MSYRSHKSYSFEIPCARIFRCLLVLSAALLFTLPLVAATKKPAKMAAPKVPPGKPEIFTLEPRGIRRGTTVKIKLIGTNLIGLTELKLHNPQLKGELLNNPEPTANEAWVTITAATNLARGPYEVSIRNTNSESSKLKLYVDDLPQAYESDSKEAKTRTSLQLPVSFWGVLDPP